MTELELIYSYGIDAWLLAGDFNLIRRCDERIGPSFNIALSARFNALLSRLQLFEIPFVDRKFTWARSASSISRALLDRVFCSTEWEHHYLSHRLSFLPQFMSDHNPLILHTNSHVFKTTIPIRFERA